MIRMTCLAAAASALLAAAPASAESWWWVAGEPGGQEAWFVDADSITPASEARVLRLTAEGAVESELRTIRCGADGADAVARFVCASPAERMEMGAMLGSLSPQVAARAIFAAPDA